MRFCIILLVFFLSCNKDNSLSCIDNRVRGKFFIEIYKFGSFSDFVIQTNISGGNCNDTLFYNQEKEVFEQAYVSCEGNKKSYEYYFTNSNATFLSLKMKAVKVGDDMKDSMRINVIGYFNNSKVFERDRTFYSWSEEKISEYEKFNIFSLDLSHILNKK